MEQLTDSDAAMLANKNFEIILSTIRSSSLNYSIQVTPFAATISLRKTIIKDKTGTYIAPRHMEVENSELKYEISNLKNKLTTLRSKHEELLCVNAGAVQNNMLLQNMIKDRDILVNELISKTKSHEKASVDHCGVIKLDTW